jgi:hypothetical protein
VVWAGEGVEIESEIVAGHCGRTNSSDPIFDLWLSDLPFSILQLKQLLVPWTPSRPRMSNGCSKKAFLVLKLT